MAVPYQPKTFNFVVDNVGNPEAIIVPIACKRVRIRENVAVATAQEFIIHAPAMGDAAFRCAAGEERIFEAQFGQEYAENTTIGYVETVTGSTTFHGLAEL